MPSVNTFITALVAGFAIGAQAGPCRPHASSSVIQYPVSTTQQTAAGTSTAYTDVASKSETKTSLSTTALRVTSTTKDESEPATAKETTTGYPVDETTSSAETLTNGSAYPTSEAEATEPAAKTTSTAKQDTTSDPHTTQDSSTAPYTTTSVPETTSKPKTTLDTTTVAPTTTSKPTTTTSAAATSSCPARSELTCAKTGFFSNANSNLIQVYYDYTLSQCQEECDKTDNCKTIGITTSNQCELYDAAVSALGFEFREGWYYSVYDACCFNGE
ncbi:hypothetical protein FVER53590_07821 [Fusarium verticillioides]|nr:hypothetical protein FVER14953_07821 [Fusarium verticillioides]RBQ85696.1 hypothetical protein FVER53263_07821 [Fusarium verticillioides]RBR22644.1 hypothetical protein FVER53590_07821 [Fusarium verticillioides]